MSSDFTRDLYNKLWDNINEKEARVWTFMSFYGATIGIILGGSSASNLLGLGLPFICIFSFWALSFLLSAEWWSARNRLIIQAIEDEHNGISDHIPTFYMSPRFTTEGIIGVSIWVVAGIQVFIMAITVMYFDGNSLCLEDEPALDSLACDILVDWESLIVGTLQVFFSGLILLSYSRREKRVLEYWDIASDYARRRRGASRRYIGIFDVSENQLRKWRQRDIESYRNISAPLLSVSVLLSCDLLYPGTWALLGVEHALSLLGLAVVAALLKYLSGNPDHGGHFISETALTSIKFDRVGLLKAMLFIQILLYAYLLD